MKNWLAAICACLVLSLVAVGCGDDEDGAGDDVTTPTQQPAGSQGGGKDGGSGGAKAESSVSVDVVDIDYEPRDVTVAQGGTITWTNVGNLPHTVTKDGGDGPDFDSGTMNEGDTFEQKFDAPGQIDYVCRIHPQQRGTITVR